MLDQLIPAPRLLEVDHVDLAASPEQVWPLVRHANLAQSPLARSLFELRALPRRLPDEPELASCRIDDLDSSPERPGFSILLDEAPREFAVGAICKVWPGGIRFVHLKDASEFLDFAEPGFVKVAWWVRVLPLGERDCRVEVEVRVDATDEGAWHEFEPSFRLIGPGTHFIRRVFLSGLARELGTPESVEAWRSLPGDELIPHARAEATDGITIAATPEQIWPWLLQMGCRRAGFYSVDWLDNRLESSRELVPELQQLSVGDVIPTTPDGTDGFEVLRVEAPHTLILGALYDTASEKQLAFNAAQPDRFWHVTWAFVLDRLDARTTRLHVRARAAYPNTGLFHVSWIRPVHHFMQRRMLKHLAARAEGRIAGDSARDVLEGAAGAAVMLAAFLTPFARHARSHWGVTEAEAAATHVGDELIPVPVWSWTHGVKIDASPELVWHWVAQIGADRGGFYSYQWLENIAGCGLRNADTIHQDWELELGDELLLHPKAPPLRVVRMERSRHLLALGQADEAAKASRKAWATATWLFELTPLPQGGCSLVSRYRLDCSADSITRLSLGPTLLEPIGFAMDRRMLLGIKQHAERQAHYALATSRSSATKSVETFGASFK